MLRRFLGYNPAHSPASVIEAVAGGKKVAEAVSVLYGTAESAVPGKADSAVRVLSSSEITKEKEKSATLVPIIGFKKVEVDPEAYPGESEVLTLILNCSAHPSQEAADMKYLRKLAKEYPLVNLVVVIRKYCLWIDAAPNRKGSRSRILTFVGRAKGDELKSSKPSPVDPERWKGRA